jgi:hypothetical protein
VNGIKTWSYSRWGTYKQCPLKAKLKFIDKLQEPGSPAMDRGTAIHLLAELFVTSKKLTPLPIELKHYEDELRLARRSQHFVEQEWGFTREWEPCTWDDERVWLKAKADLGFWPVKSDRSILRLVDHKTGKRRDEHEYQLGLYALLAFLMFPEVQTVETEVWYLDQGKPSLNRTYRREQTGYLQILWENEVRPFFSDEMWAPRPSYLCRWCHFRKDNGGPCQM